MSKDQSDKFVMSPAGTVMSQCVYCRHASRGSFYPVCAAFPGGIPDAILRNAVDHRRPYLEDGRPADRGVALQGPITFSPRDDVPPAILAALARTLDAIP